MTNLNWMKTKTGYTADGYTIDRTPGRRWVVTCNGKPVADGKQFGKLSDAQAAADADVSARAVTRLNEPAEDEQRSDFAVTTETEDAPDTLPVVPTANDSLPPSSPSAVVEPKSVSPEIRFLDARSNPRESLTDQYTRLVVYRDIGIRRAYESPVGKYQKPTLTAA